MGKKEYFRPGLFFNMVMPSQEKIIIRGLIRSAGWIFCVWGCIVTLRGVWDAFWGEPEANYFSSVKWEFITQEQWHRYSGFEISYGLACIGIAYLLWKFSSLVPEFYTRPAQQYDERL
ncbi:MAG: hypothetical protein GF384_03225 [Elusimicrobia bacterium]|nr:hypothetical protein [Elusimicrobiota bacterium]MBD3411938.1 hypothetical protein [Elusimicrobiota bacterium]